MNPERGHGGLASDPSALPIVVANAVDASFLPLVEIVATSIAASATSGRPVDYHVLYDGPDSPAAARLVGWRAGPVAIHLHRVVNPFTGLGRISGYPPSTLFRLAIEDVLADCGRVLYLDTDLLVRADLGELFDTPLDGAAIGAAPDIGAIENTLLRRPEGARLALWLVPLLPRCAGPR
ncbi:MAG: hypothetical protein IPK28_08470 [Devosia sp.]|nr:hypothetical protein [Devosia sp.]